MEADTVSMTSEMSRMSFEFTRRGIDRSLNLDREVIGYKTITISELIYEDELVKNMTTKISYEITNTNSNSIYVPINVCLERYNK